MPRFDDDLDVISERRQRQAMEALGRQRFDRLLTHPMSQPLGIKGREYWQGMHDDSDFANLQSIRKTGRMAPTRAGFTFGRETDIPSTANSYQQGIGEDEPDFARANFFGYGSGAQVDAQRRNEQNALKALDIQGSALDREAADPFGDQEADRQNARTIRHGRERAIAGTEVENDPRMVSARGAIRQRTRGETREDAMDQFETGRDITQRSETDPVMIGARERERQQRREDITLGQRPAMTGALTGALTDEYADTPDRRAIRGALSALNPDLFPQERPPAQVAPSPGADIDSTQRAADFNEIIQDYYAEYGRVPSQDELLRIYRAGQAQQQGGAPPIPMRR